MSLFGYSVICWRFGDGGLVLRMFRFWDCCCDGVVSGCGLCWFAVLILEGGFY